MAVPATTGQLRTKVSEMEIGDYIKMGSVNNAGWKFDNGTVELPANGIPMTQSFGNYYFYLIKVAKGLLIADRVAQHTATWDSLNSNKLIQGLPFDSGNIIPTMTNNTSPSGVASASSSYTGAVNYEPWKAFDKLTSLTDRWVAAGTQAWISYQFNDPTVVTQYSLATYTGPADWKTSMAKDWTFEGSKDGISWDILDSQKGISNWESGAKQKFTFPNKTPYLMYRLNVTTNNGGGYVSIFEIEMFETAGTIRSLTGGVAYADVNGNKTMNASGSIGAWPQNNEWDKYILNFPADKIQVDKSLEDVFHYKNIWTLTQDTPMNGTLISTTGTTGVTANTQRTIRGYEAVDPKWMGFGGGTSSYSGVTSGFRPVFEYKEV